MATTPNDPQNGDKPKKKRDLEQEMLMREVDEAVRSDDVTDALQKYGMPIGTLLVLGLAAFGGYLWWNGQQEAALEQQSEIIVQALDEMEAQNLTIADQELATVDGEVSPGALASATMLRAGIALQDGRVADAVALYDQVVQADGVAKPMRDAAQIRLVAANFDNMDPQDVIDRLGPLATADSPWFGSAGEMVAHAYIAQDKMDQAGPLMIAIAQDEGVPESLRARVRQLAGHLGIDAVEDVDDMLDSMRSEEGANEGTAQ